MQQDLDSWERADIGVICDKCHKKTDTFLVYESYKLCVKCNDVLNDILRPIAETIEQKLREYEQKRREYEKVCENRQNILEAFVNDKS
jgi:hypothetical protein